MWWKKYQRTRKIKKTGKAENHVSLRKRTLLVVKKDRAIKGARTRNPFTKTLHVKSKNVSAKDVSGGRDGDSKRQGTCAK